MWSDALLGLLVGLFFGMLIGGSLVVLAFCRFTLFLAAIGRRLKESRGVGLGGVGPV